MNMFTAYRRLMFFDICNSQKLILNLSPLLLAESRMKYLA